MGIGSPLPSGDVTVKFCFLFPLRGVLGVDGVPGRLLRPVCLPVRPGVEGCFFLPPCRVFIGKEAKRVRELRRDEGQRSPTMF